MSFHEQEIRFAAPGGARLAGSLLTPEGEGPFPALLFASGSGPQTRDEEVLGHPVFKTIAHWFGARGVASLRFDDRGAGESEGRHEESSVAQDVADLGAALAFLRARPEIDPGRLRLIGHSQGGLTAALLAQQAKVEAVAALAAPAEAMTRILHRQARFAGIEAGYSEVVLAHLEAMNDAAFRRVLAGGDPERLQAETAEILREGLARWPDPLGLSEAQLAESAAQMAATLVSPPFASLLAQDMAQVWGGLKTPLIAFFGGRDRQVPGFANLKALRALAPPESLRQGRVFPRLNHLFQEAQTGAVAEYEGLGQAPAPELLEALARAFEKLTRRPRAPRAV